MNFLLPIDHKYSKEDFIPIDLSSNNKDLNHLDNASAKEWEIYINQYLQTNKAEVAFGGYLEKRNLYDRSTHFGDLEELDKRNIHLGVEFWCEVGTKIIIPFDGKINIFQNNQNYGDYGPTIILEHNLDKVKLYSLYGHLSLESIKNLEAGTKLKQGDILAELGNSNVNGNYASHLHFQLIRNLEGNSGDYPGVCSEGKIDFYKNNCPNPMDYFTDNLPQ